MKPTGAARKIRVSGPGQNVCMRIFAAAGISSTRGITSRSSATITAIGFRKSRPLIRKIFSTAVSFRASAPRP